MVMSHCYWVQSASALPGSPQHKLFASLPESRIRLIGYDGSYKNLWWFCTADLQTHPSQEREESSCWIPANLSSPPMPVPSGSWHLTSAGCSSQQFKCFKWRCSGKARVNLKLLYVLTQANNQWEVGTAESFVDRITHGWPRRATLSRNCFSKVQITVSTDLLELSL